MLLGGFWPLAKRSVRGLAEAGGEGSPVRLPWLISRTLLEGALDCVVEVLDVDWRLGFVPKAEL